MGGHGTGRRHILETTLAELGDWLAAEGEPTYRLGQILDWVYARRADSFDAMTNLPAGLRGRLAERFEAAPPNEVDRLVSADGDTGKLLLQLGDGERIECVWMNDGGRYTFCISSQAGCALGCVFCATGAGGFGRDLTAAEILGQVTALARATGELRNVVFMGMGEPLLNLAAVIPSLEALVDEDRFGLGARRLTVSTAGIPDGIHALIDSGLRPNLALSLNSPFDEQRRELMPIARKHPLPEVLDACRDYARATARRVLIEYVLLGSVNTGPDAADAVAAIASDLTALVNLIPFNTVADSGFRPPEQAEVAQFRKRIEARGVGVTERYRRGRDIAAACGQLRGGHAHRGRGAEM